jgi:hypothetical protein
LWDHLHDTFRWDGAQQPIGIPAYRSPGEVRLLPSLALPFARQRDAWVPLATAYPRA